jgi:hypothetical protein
MSFKTYYNFIANAALCWVCTFAWSARTEAASATNYQGTDAILRQAAESSNKTRSKDERLSPNAQLRADLKAFGQQSVSLTPGDAAKQWLALADRLVQMEETPANYGQQGEPNPVQMEELVDELPPPASWAELEKAIEARPHGEGTQALHELGLRLLAHVLVGDAAKRRDDIAALENLAAKAKSRQAYFYSSLFEELRAFSI